MRRFAVVASTKEPWAALGASGVWPLPAEEGQSPHGPSREKRCGSRRPRDTEVDSRAGAPLPTSARHSSRAPPSALRRAWAPSAIPTPSPLFGLSTVTARTRLKKKTQPTTTTS